MKRSKKYRSAVRNAWEALVPALDTIAHASAPPGWERKFQPGDAVEVEERYADGTREVLAGCVVRCHRVGWLVRTRRGLHYYAYLQVRPRGATPTAAGAGASVSP